MVERCVRDAEVVGSNPVASTFIWPIGQAVKTPPSHGGNRGSIPLLAIVDTGVQRCSGIFCVQGTKVFLPHEPSHKWGKDFGTRPYIRIARDVILRYANVGAGPTGVRSTKQSVDITTKRKIKTGKV